jgi:hypothetical protein
VVSSERKKRAEAAATSSIAVLNASSFAFDGLLKPLILRTNWSEAARISSSFTGGSKLKRVLIFLHIGCITWLLDEDCIARVAVKDAGETPALCRCTFGEQDFPRPWAERVV